jgi:hypothetical protein
MEDPIQAMKTMKRHSFACAALLAAGAVLSQAQPIAVPNGSFESQSGQGQMFGVNIFVDSWQKAPEPGFWAAIQQQTGYFWIQTAGVFVDTNPYENRDGAQAGYLLAFPGVRLFQDYTTLDWNDALPSHEFDATYQVGLSYNLTVGVFGKSSLAPGSTLQLSLYYLDESSARIVIASNVVVYSEAAFPSAAPLNLVDYQVNLPKVQAGDDWAGKHIGIQLESTVAFELATGGNWDFDNVRLTAVPEPGALSLLLTGAGAWLWRRSSRRTSLGL